MKFDPELMRDVLIAIEDLPADKPLNGTFEFEGRNQAEVNRHIQLLVDEEYLYGKTVLDHVGAPRAFLIRDLTMKGHQFLANARNDTVWKKVMAQAKEKGMSVGLTVLNQLLEHAAKKYAGIE